MDYMEKDIRNLRKALEILDVAENETAFQCMIKRILFPHGCSESVIIDGEYKYSRKPGSGQNIFSEEIQD